MLTIFTPTYNRAETLPRLYESLLRQKDKGAFEWVVVDDGSADDTKRIVEGWTEEGKISIRYFYQENAGKMQAWNLGVSKARGDFFMCLDSDDYLTDDSVEIITNFCEKQTDWEGLCGINGYKGQSDTVPIFEKYFPKVKADTLEGLFEKGFAVDTALVFLTEILRQYPFPRIEGEKFITEGYIYDKIEKNYRFLILPEILTVCHYREDGYTCNRLSLKFAAPKGWQLFYEQKIGIRKGIMNKYVMAANYDWCCLIDESPGKIFKGEHMFWKISAIPLGIRYYFMHRKAEKAYRSSLK